MLHNSLAEFQGHNTNLAYCKLDIISLNATEIGALRIRSTRDDKVENWITTPPPFVTLSALGTTLILR